jgi:hypothetical protein
LTSAITGFIPRSQFENRKEQALCLLTGNRSLHEKLMVAQLVKKSLTFMESKSLPVVTVLSQMRTVHTAAHIFDTVLPSIPWSTKYS